MKRVRYLVILALAPFAAWCSGTSEDPEFARYRSIIDRMPFGEPPPNFDPTLAPGSAAAAAAAATAAAAGGMTEEQRTEEEQKLASSVRVSVLNVTPAGRTMVGFTDSSAKPPEHYYLPVGGERDGWSVKSADPATEKVTLAKGELEVTLKLGEGSTGNAKDGKQKSSSPRSFLHGRRLGSMGVNLANGPMGGRLAQVAGEPPNEEGALARLRKRRSRKLLEEQAENERAAKAAAEEKAERERRAAADAVAAEQAAAEREQQRAEREQQRAALQQIQEELRRQREEKEKQRAQDQEETEG